jgi:hypothetical protein
LDDLVEFAQFTTSFREYNSIKTRGVLFTSASHQRRPTKKNTVKKESAWDNTGIMLDYLDDKDTQQVAFGVIQRIYVHQLSKSSEKCAIVKVYWFEKIGSEYDGEMPVVRDPAKVTDPQARKSRTYKDAARWNEHNQFAFLSDAHAQNVVYWPKDITRPTAPELVALWSRAAYRILDE